MIEVVIVVCEKGPQKRRKVHSCSTRIDGTKESPPFANVPVYSF